MSESRLTPGRGHPALAEEICTSLAQFHWQWLFRLGVEQVALSPNGHQERAAEFHRCGCEDRVV